MALSKTIKAALDAWKEGKGEFPDALETGSHFDNDGAYLASWEPRAKKREQAAREAATAELLEKLGITDPAEIEQIKAKLDESGAAKTEVEKLKAMNDKTAKELAKEQKRTADLTGKLQGVAKRDALMPFAGRVRSTKALSAMLEHQLVVGEDGTVTGPEGKTVEALVDELLKTESYLANPDFKAGAGTGSAQPKVKVPYVPPKGADGKDQPLSLGQAMVNEMVASGQLTGPKGTGGP